VYDRPATLLCNGFTVFSLTLDGKTVHGSIERDAKVNGSTCCYTTNTSAP